MSGDNETFFEKYFTDLAIWLLFLLKLQTRSRVKKKSQKVKKVAINIVSSDEIRKCFDLMLSYRQQTNLQFTDNI